jgi:hypothetical protein
MDELKSFLSENQGNRVWFLVSPGYIVGILNMELENEDDPIHLTDPILYRDGQENPLPHLLLFRHQIFSWGLGYPV